MAYTPTYIKPYSNGWENLPSKATPVTAEALNGIDNAIEAVEVQIKNTTTIYDEMAINLGRKTDTGVGSYSVAAGINVEASGIVSHAEGYGTKASGRASHAEGDTTTALGNESHAEGYYTIASGACTHAEGIGTLATSLYQHVQGKFNEEDTETLYAHIVGNGTSARERKNIHTLDWSGNAWFAGDVADGNGDSIASIKEIALGAGSTAKVFGTKAELDEWLAVEGNSDTLSAGQDIYIVEIDTPDYWWDGTGLQELETGKITIEELGYDETMEILNAENESEGA